MRSWVLPACLVVLGLLAGVAAWSMATARLGDHAGAPPDGVEAMTCSPGGGGRAGSNAIRLSKREVNGIDAGGRTTLTHKPSLDDFLDGDREAVAAMLRDVVRKFRSPFTPVPSSRAVTILLECRVQFVRDGVVEMKCLSGGPELDLGIDDCAQFYYQPEWAQKEFGVSAGVVAVGEVRTCVVYGSGFGGKLWKRFLIFPGPVH